LMNVAGKRKAAKAAEPPSFMPITYEPSRGQVAIHVEMEPRAYCGAEWSGNASLESGELPPGLTFDPSSHRIAGTPRLPGTWNVVVAYTNSGCRGRSYPDQRVRLPIVIEP